LNYGSRRHHDWFRAAIVLALLIAPTTFHELGLSRWLHIVSGITDRLLYYFNLVQIPGLAAAAADKAAPAALASASTSRDRLLWFRWAALATG